jgi:eukaryotic-like serine/threonine-protein kinase
MDLDRRCLRCGSSLPPPAPWGACPACLLRAGLVGGSTDLESGPLDAACHASGGRTPWDEATIALGTGGPGASRSDGAPEARAAASGAMPTVLLRDPQMTTPETPVNRPSSPELPDRGDTAGRYQLFGEIARGGMGAVLKGRDADLGRDLAVKVLLGRHRDEPELVRRFIEEAQISGQLQHPGIVPVYELGRLPDGRPFFAMKLVKGRTLGCCSASATARPMTCRGSSPSSSRSARRWRMRTPAGWSTAT